MIYYTGTRHEHKPNSVTTKYGVDQSGKITYAFDHHGFRKGPKRHFNKFVVFCGCSHTFGTGVQRPWPWVVSEHMESNYFNLSQGGASPDYVARTVMSFLYSGMRPEAVFILWPRANRGDYILPDGRIAQYGPWLADVSMIELYRSAKANGQDLFELIRMRKLARLGHTEINQKDQLIKNIILVGNYCKLLDIKCHMFAVDDGSWIRDCKNGYADMMKHSCNVSYRTVSDFANYGMQKDGYHYSQEAHDEFGKCVIYESQTEATIWDSTRS